ncbi:MAG: transglycosylase domain-containing protein [Pseudomonadales bacterium]
MSVWRRFAAYRWVILAGALVGLFGASVFGYWLWQATVAELRPVPTNFAAITAHVSRAQITDRHGRALNATYANDWNLHEAARLHEMPERVVNAFVEAEDRRFFEHGGPDWLARLRALGQNVLALRAVSGASTITEQVVRMINPRPRTLWSRWLEGWEAAELERAHGKLAVLEFYLNQVPYAANRRGVVQAAHYYFDRDLDTLSAQEALALAVLVRAPSRLDLWKDGEQAVAGSLSRLAERMGDRGYLTSAEVSEIATRPFALKAPALEVDAQHFLEHVERDRPGAAAHRVRTTLDGTLQARLQGLVDRRIETLAPRNVTNGALLAANHQTGEIVAWVVGGADDRSVAGRGINAVVAPRQPGSALKPFLYALALEHGWTASTLIDDAPLSEMVGTGLHSYSNYSRAFYGPLTLRNALGNSLNIPALRAVQHTGAAAYLALLRDLGFETLTRHPDFYGDGLALGNGEVTLLELVTAFAAIANRGVYRELAARADEVGTYRERRVLSAEVASLIGNILSDPSARELEFGRASLLDLPVQTAVKTGTSSDYRDSWAVGFDHRYVVGVWMGNLNQTATLGITGSTGPALVLRGAFDLLNRDQQTRPLWLSPKLARHVVCAETGAAAVAGQQCRERSEYFLPGTGPGEADIVPGEPGADRGETQLASRSSEDAPAGIRLRQPTPGLRMAYDPRLPAEAQAFEFVLQGVADTDRVEWRVDGGAAQPGGSRYLWPLSRGEHFVSASVHREGELVALVPAVGFFVK